MAKPWEAEEAQHLGSQLPVLSPSSFGGTEPRFIVPRVLEPAFTSDDLPPYVEDMVAGDSWYDEAPLSARQLFVQGADRRIRLRAELDAYYARLYGLTLAEPRYFLTPPT